MHTQHGSASMQKAWTTANVAVMAGEYTDKYCWWWWDNRYDPSGFCWLRRIPDCSHKGVLKSAPAVTNVMGEDTSGGLNAPSQFTHVIIEPFKVSRQPNVHEFVVVGETLSWNIWRKIVVWIQFEFWRGSDLSAPVNVTTHRAFYCLKHSVVLY